MQYTVSVETFEGPMGLLLQLIEDGRVEVTTLSVSEITRNYLLRLQALPDLNPDELSDFLQLGSRLVYIKSLALLPASGNASQEEELTQLNIELEEYRRFQLVAVQLAKRSSARSWQRPQSTKLSPAERPLPQVQLSALQSAFAEALKRTQPDAPTSVIKAHLSQATVSKRLLASLRTSAVKLHDYLETISDRTELIITFLAVLELLKAGSIQLRLTPAGPTIEANHA